MDLENWNLESCEELVDGECFQHILILTILF